MSALIPLIPGKVLDGPMTMPPPSGVILNNTNSNTTIPKHEPVLCSGILADGKEDTWLEYVPESLPAGKKPPLVISCHGGGASADLQFNENSWWCVAEAEGLIVVFPNAGGQTKSWLSEDKPPKPGERPSMLDVFTASPDGRASEEHHHIKFLKALIGEMKRKYDIDESRVYMQGMSMGDIMTMMFSRVCGNLLAGADSTAGPSPEVALFDENGNVKGNCGPVPIYQSRGELDNIVVAKKPGEDTTRQDINAANRRFWLKVNECDDLPRLAILGVNNFMFYTGKKANVVYRDVKHRGHGQTLDDSYWAWETLFKGTRRNPDGSLTCMDTEFSATGDRDAVAVVDGGRFAYVNNQRIRLEAPVFSEALTNFDFATREMVEVKRDLYVPVTALEAMFGASVTRTQEGQGAVIETECGSCEIVAESVACLQGTFVRAMFMPAKLRDGVLCVPLRWFAEEIFGRHVTECDGALYAADHHGEMTKDMAYLLHDILR